MKTSFQNFILNGRTSATVSTAMLILVVESDPVISAQMNDDVDGQLSPEYQDD